MNKLFCEECGETEDFKARQDITEYGTATIAVDIHGDYQDTLDEYINESESDGSPYEHECMNCGTHVEFYNESEYETVTQKWNRENNIVANWQQQLGDNDE